MKKNKIIGIAVACAGVVASFALASALSVKPANDTSFTITAKTSIDDDGIVRYSFPHTGESTYTRNFVSTDGSQTAGTKFDLTYTQVHYTFNLGASYEQCIAQDYVVGNLTFKFSNLVNALKGHLRIYIVVNGYVADSQGKALYENAFLDYSEGAPGDHNYVVTAESLNENGEFILSRDIAVDLVGTQSIDAYIKLDGTEAQIANILYQADEGSPFELDVTWGAASSDYHYVYIHGDGNVWKQSEGHRMVPNINKTDGFEWYYKNLTDFTALKLVKEGTWYGYGGSTSGGDITQDTEDHDLAKANRYNVYWSGAENSPISVVKQAA